MSHRRAFSTQLNRRLIASLPRVLQRAADKRQSAQLLDQALQPYANAGATRTAARVATGRAWWMAGDTARALGGQGIATGLNATVGAAAANGIATGTAAQSQAAGGIATGFNARVDAGATNGIATGTNALAMGNAATAIGSGAQAVGANSAAYGVAALATGGNSAAVGNNAQATGQSSVASGALR